jgi:hypothetical protein
MKMITAMIGSALLSASIASAATYRVCYIKTVHDVKIKKVPVFVPVKHKKPAPAPVEARVITLPCTIAPLSDTILTAPNTTFGPLDNLYLAPITTPNKRVIDQPNRVVAFTIPQGSSPVPEPSTWAMAIVGFGLIGGMMRKKPPVLAQV